MADTAGRSYVRTSFPDGSQPPFWLGRLGHVGALKYSRVLPGGAEALSCTLARPPSFRHPAMDPGRVLEVTRGGSVVWRGKATEPQPGPSGWTISAVGEGVLGADYRAYYTTWNQNNPLDQAIGRGLPWNKSSLSSSGLWLSQVPDPASITITDFLNLITASGGQTWYADRYGTLQVVSFPLVTSAPTRLLVATEAVSRTVAADVNFLYERYQATADNVNTGATASYATTSSSVPGANRHQEQEDYLDLSSAAVMSAATAQAAGNAVLAKYQRANWGGPFTVPFGRYLSTGGVPVDLGCEREGEICKLLVTDAGYGGEVVPVPIVFVVGRIEFDDDAHVATVEPYQAVTSRLADMMQAVANALTISATA
jgi:hypothetical protein